MLKSACTSVPPDHSNDSLSDATRIDADAAADVEDRRVPSARPAPVNRRGFA